MSSIKKLGVLASVATLSAAALLTGCSDSTPPAPQSSAPTAQPAETSPAPAPAAPSEVAAQGLDIEVYNPGTNAIFAVSSVLVTGKEDAILLDAQFSTTDAQNVVDLIKASGKRLTTIYISHGDPDFYFGQETLHAAFPDAQILATPQTIAHIEATKDGKLETWGPKLADGAPKQIIVPQPLEGDTLTLEGQELKIIGLDSPAPDRTVVWIPSIKTVAGGIPVMAGEHVWIADTQTPESRQHWLAILDRIKALEPEVVVPGHFAPGASQDLSAVEFTADYIRSFEEEAAKANNSEELIAAMKERFPGLEGEGSLELSAKVIKGELAWH